MLVYNMDLALRRTHGTHWSRDDRRRENAAREAARRCQARARQFSSSKKSQVRRPIVRPRPLEDPVAKAKQRLAAYKRQEEAAARQEATSQRRTPRRPALWYSQSTAKRLASAAAERQLAAATARAECRRQVLERLEVLAQTVARLMHGRFGAYERGSFVLWRLEPRIVCAWQPSEPWCPTGYRNRLVASHQPPWLARPFAPPPPLPGYAFRFAVRALRAKESNFRPIHPRWRLAAAALRVRILADPKFLEKRKRDFKAQVEATRRFLRDWELRPRQADLAMRAGALIDDDDDDDDYAAAAALAPGPVASGAPVPLHGDHVVDVMAAGQ